MPSMQEIELQSKALIALLAPIAKDIQSLREQNSLLQKQLADLQAKEIDIHAIAQKAASLVEVKHGVDGAPGQDGKSVTVDEMLPVVDRLVSEKFSQIEPPKNGEKGDRGEPGEPGKSVSKDDVLPDLKSHAEAVLVDLVAALPVPKDGKSVTAEEAADIILPQLKSYADDMISKIPLPEPKSVSPEEVAELLESRVTESLGNVLESHVKTIKDAAEAVIAEIPVPVNGKDGKDGTSVSIDDLLPHVQKMAQELFDSIPKPKDGERGEPGKDAIDIDILPFIDFEKSYPRGTWAHHNGGIYKSHANTLGERGWECIINGIASIDVDKTGDREITVKIVDSRGEQVVKTFSTHDAIYRGIYDEKKDAEYTEGDMATCGGSVWYCLSDNPGRPGDANKSWKLAVKRGRDGKEGRDGIDLTKPVTIGDKS